MDILNTYLEMMGDTEFAVYAAIFVFGLIVLIGLMGKLVQGNPAAVTKPELKIEPKPKKDLPAPDTELKAPEKAPPPIPAPPPTQEGVMMWEFDDGKNKKSKKAAVVPEKPVAVVPSPQSPPLLTAVPPAEAVKKKELASTPPPAPSNGSEEKTVILSPKEAASVKAALPPAVLSPAAPPPKMEEVEAPEKSFVDIQMYETLVRRIAGLEADLRREPLYLDPLMKRMGTAEKRLEDMKSPQGHAAGGADPEVKELKEKVAKLQKVLEQLSEGPPVDAPLKSSTAP